MILYVLYVVLQCDKELIVGNVDTDHRIVSWLMLSFNVVFVLFFKISSFKCTPSTVA